MSTLLLSDRQRGLIIVDATDVLTPGDYNQDGFVNAADYAVWRSEFSQDVFHHGTLISDGNGDGFVDAADYVVWRANILAVAAGLSAADSTAAGVAVSAAAVPEPVLLLLAIVASAHFSWFYRCARTPCPIGSSPGGALFTG